MSALGEISDSLQTSSSLPSNTTTVLIITGSVLVILVFRIMSPERLTNTLVSALATAEDSYIQAVGFDALEGQSLTLAGERLAGLQVQVSILRESVLRSRSQSWWRSLFQYLQFYRAYEIVCCIWAIRLLQIDIEIMRERRLRDTSPVRSSAIMEAIALRRRRFS